MAARPNDRARGVVPLETVVVRNQLVVPTVISTIVLGWNTETRLHTRALTSKARFDAIMG